MKFLDDGLQVTLILDPLLVEVEKAMRHSFPIKITHTSIYNSDKLGKNPGMGSGVKAEYIHQEDDTFSVPLSNSPYRFADWMLEKGIPYELPFDMSSDNLNDAQNLILNKLKEIHSPEIFSPSRRVQINIKRWDDLHLHKILTQDHMNTWLLLYSKMYEISMFHNNHPQTRDNPYLNFEFSALKRQMEMLLVDIAFRTIFDGYFHEGSE